MGSLLIKCPHSGRPISTGIEIEADSLLNLPDVLSHVKCPECRLEHAWWTREGGWRGLAKCVHLTRRQRSASCPPLVAHPMGSGFCDRVG